MLFQMFVAFTKEAICRYSPYNYIQAAKIPQKFLTYYPGRGFKHINYNCYLQFQCGLSLEELYMEEP